MDGILAALGAGSGLQTSDIIAGLLAAEREPKVERIEAQRESIDAQVSALGQVRSALSAFSSALSDLKNSGVLGVQPQLSRTDLATATVTSRSARPQNLSFSVEALASSQTLASSGFAAAEAGALGTGTVTLNFGTLTQDAAGQPSAFAPGTPARTLTIDIAQGEDNLATIAAKINEADAGVSASVINDGSAERLIVKGADGAENAFTIDVATAAGNPLERLAFGVGTATGMTATKSATNAELLVEGVAVSRPGNRISDLIEGTTLTLTKAEPGAIVNYAASYDEAELATAMQNFTAAYNEMNSLMGEFSARAADGEEAGPLNGSRALRELQAELRSLTTDILAPGDGVSRLSDIGIRISRDGSLLVDSAKLESAVRSAPDLIASMFHDNQAAGADGITLQGTISGAEPGTYSFTNIVAGSAGVLSGQDASSAFSTPLVIDAANREFRVSVDGRGSLTIPLVEGSYTDGNGFAAMMTEAIRGDALLGTFNAGATVSWDGAAFSIRSSSAGSKSAVSILEMDATLSQRLGLDTAVAQAGTDATGQINGVSVTGTGNNLTIPAGSPGAGMRFTVTKNVATANVQVSHGIDTRLAKIAAELSDSDSPFGSNISRLSRQRADLDKEETALTARLVTYEDRLRAQFGAMEAAVAGFKATQDFLDQQIDLWSNSDS
ncbi:flagellar filament capping protein FliD [Pacificimonas sp. ICDLI1SI03]